MTDHLCTVTQTVVINTHFSPEVNPVLITCFCSLINIDSPGRVATARGGGGRGWVGVRDSLCRAGVSGRLGPVVAATDGAVR